MPNNNDGIKTKVGVMGDKEYKAALAQINSWVSEHTDGLINELLSEGEITSDTVAALINTLTLELEWQDQFIAMRELKEFNGTEGKQNVPFIRSNNSFANGSFDEGEIAVIPYMGDEYRMAVILPAEGVSAADAACALMGRWNECTDKQGTVIMPKVELDSHLDVMAFIKELGIEEAVNGNYTKLLSGDVEAPVSAIVQGAKLIVNEYGTIAAAATAVISYKGLPIEEFVMECNRPYAMAIYNTETGTVLFVSIVNNVD